MKWYEFDHNGEEAFEDSVQDKRPPDLVNVERKLAYGNLVGRIRRVDRGCSDIESNIDPALSEAEAVWMLSDSDENEDENENEDAGGKSQDNGKRVRECLVVVEDDNGDGDDEKEISPDNGLSIPGFRRVTRQSTRVEVRGHRKGKIPFVQKRGRAATDNLNSKRKQ